MKQQVAERHKYMETAHTLFISLTELNMAKDVLINTGVLDYWLEITIRGVEADGRTSIDERAISLSKVAFNSIGFLADIWMLRSEKFEEREDLANSILNAFKKICRDKIKTLRVTNHF